ncbi:DUF4129 domain-containing protein [Psychroserpens sp. BH13MA-6]
MSKIRCLHIVFLIFGMTGYAGTLDVMYQDSQDSVLTDTAPIEKRSFEDLKDKYDGDEFIYERTTENSGWWTRFKQWLSDFFRDLFDINSDARASEVTDIILKVFAAILFILVLFFIVKAIMNKEGSWVFGKSSDKNIIPVTDIENNIFETDFKTLIQNAEDHHNYRLAIRYYYLWLLKKLAKAEYIEYDVEKTNSDYYLELSEASIKKDFAYTSYLYNYIWYGEFDIDQAQYEKAKEAFAQFLNAIKV